MENDTQKEKTPIIIYISAIILYSIIGFGLLVTYPFLFFIFMICLFFAFISFIINIFIKMKLKFQRLAPADFGLYKGYYRDIINEYSPLVLSYIDNFKITDKDIVGTLLKLQLKKHIEIKNNKDIHVLKNSSYKLYNTEKYVLENYIDKINYMELKKIVEAEALEQGLLQYRFLDKKKFNKKIIILVLIFIISLFIFSPLFSMLSNVTSDMGILYFVYTLLSYLLSFGLLYPIIRIPYLILYQINIKKIPFVRSKKANKINEKLAGLKNYIRDFSMLDKRNLEDLTLWEEYLIYSVIFGQNKEINISL